MYSTDQLYGKEKASGMTTLECKLEKLVEGIGQMKEPLLGMQLYNEVQNSKQPSLAV